ncbi:MmpL domain protein [Perkinsus olseni]|uniref:MmpL domain protein n=1 Tax=Perkinsus olseni TaxID=32597 RepID=A0A7J6TVV8_PEROL|nr:MmpL domain protein [Perkinsus olseni]
MRSTRCRISFPTLRKCGEAYVDLLRRLRYFLLPFWLVLLGGCIVGTMHIYDNIDNGVDPGEDSPIAHAYRAMVRLYGGEQEFTPEVLLVELPADAKGDLFTDGLIDAVTKTVEDYWKDWPDVEIQGYVSAQVLPGVSTFFMSKLNRSSIITVIFPPDWGIDAVYEQEQDVWSAGLPQGGPHDPRA